MTTAILAAASVVFVCEHGNVKSLIAMQWFNRLAAQRNHATRAVSRGLVPESPVPPAIRDRLREDGFDVSAFQARPLTGADVSGAARLVVIGTDVPGWARPVGVPVEVWRDIPPATEGYDAARDALKARIVALLASLTPPPAKR
jgi:arsenate reductase (thioredoxin)